jgi:hypothetical protein
MLQLHKALASCTLTVGLQDGEPGFPPSPPPVHPRTRPPHEGRGRRSCRHLTGARHASPRPSGRATVGKRNVAAGPTAEHRDHPAGGPDPAGMRMFWDAARHGVDPPSHSAQTSLAGRGASQAQRRVAGSSARATRGPVDSMPTLRVSTIRSSPVLRGRRA